MERMLTAIIAQNGEKVRGDLEEYAANNNIGILSCVSSGEWLIDDCINFKPDFVVIDVNLAGMDGLAAYKKIVERGVSPYLILVSENSHIDLFVTAFELNCVDVLTRPFSDERLSAALTKVRNQIKKDLVYTNKTPGRMLQLKSDYRTIFINENNLIYAQKMKGKHKTILHIEGGKGDGIETTSCIREIQKQCSDHIFSPNQSNLVNMKFIKTVHASETVAGTYIIQLSHNDIEIDLTRRKRKDFERLQNRLKEM